MPAPIPEPAPRPDPVVVVMPPQKPGKVKVKPPKEPKEQPMTARLDGTVGTGDAVVNLSSFSGSLHLKKR